nr:hypothetical protein [Tanacetum cinerariifolium]
MVILKNFPNINQYIIINLHDGCKTDPDGVMSGGSASESLFGGGRLPANTTFGNGLDAGIVSGTGDGGGGGRGGGGIDGGGGGGGLRGGGGGRRGVGGGGGRCRNGGVGGLCGG